MNKKILQITLSLAILAFGCTEKFDVETEKLQFEKIEEKSISLTSEEIKEISFLLGGVFEKNREALHEFYFSSRDPKNGGEANFEFASYLKSYESNYKKKSIIVDEFLNLGAEFRMDGDFNELVERISRSNLKITAPYLAENFDIGDISNFTISWYHYSMEEPHLDDPNWEGETPGVLFGASFNGGRLDFDDSNYLIVNDDYAISNPTIVVGEFDEPIFREEDPYLPPSAILKLRCPDLKNDTRFTLRMPKIRLMQNLRPWPNGNDVYLWVVTGLFEFGTDGVPKPDKFVFEPIRNYRIRRSETNLWKDSPASFIVSNWKYESDDVSMVWGYYYPKSEFSFTGDVKISDKGGVSGGVKVEYKLTSTETLRRMSNQNFDKCFLLEDNFHVIDQGQGIINNYPIYQMSQMQWYFTASH